MALTHDGHVAMNEYQVTAHSGDMLLKGTYAHRESVYFYGERRDVAANTSQMFQDQILDIFGYDDTHLFSRLK